MMIGMGIPSSQSKIPRMDVLLGFARGPERGCAPPAPDPAAPHPLVTKGHPPARTSRRALLRCLPLLAATAAGCATDPGGDYLAGFGDPVRGAALNAPRNLGDTSRWAG